MQVPNSPAVFSLSGVTMNKYVSNMYRKHHHERTASRIRGSWRGAGWTRLFAVIVSLALGFPASAVPAAAGGEDSIRVGILVPLSGGGGAYGPGMVNAAQKAAEIINNQAGGVLEGKKLELFVADSESNATAGVAAARKLLDVSSVKAVAGCWSSSVAMAVKPLTIEKGVPLLVSGTGDEVTQGDNKGLVWRFQATGSGWGRAFAKAVSRFGAKKASILVLQAPFTLSMVEPFKEDFTAAGGTVLDTVFYNPNQTSYRAEVERIFGRNPDVVYMPSYLPDLSSVVREVYRSGFTSTIFANSSAADAEGAFVKNVGREVAEGIHHVQSIPAVDSQSYKYFARVAGVPEGHIAIFPSNMWDEISVLALAIESSQSTDPKIFAGHIIKVVNGPGVGVDNVVDGLKALREGKTIKYNGAGAEFTFAPNGDELNRFYGHFVIKDGVNHLVEIIQ
jgi:branched-chain amino acid transport system substrate-binding protein